MTGRTGSIVHKLHSRQLGSQQRRLYTQVPARLQFPIESVVDKDKRLLGCILLGFSADGDHLLSYTSTGGYHLQVWGYKWGEPAKHLVNIKLFEGASSTTPLGDSDSSDDDARDNLLGLTVTVTETADQQLLIVHGASQFKVEDDSLPLDTMNYVTVLPNPCLYRCCLQGCHFKYTSIRGFVCQPLFAFIPPQTLIMHSSLGIQFVQLLQQLPKTSPTGSWPAQRESLHSQARQGARTEINSTAMTERAEASHTQQPVHADPACQLGRQMESQISMEASTEPFQQADLQQNLPEDGHGLCEASMRESEADANTQGRISSMYAACRSKPAHSVWSMSASSEASSSHTDISETSPDSPPVSESLAPLPDAIASLIEHGEGSDGVSLFTVCARSCTEPNVKCGVTAEMLMPAFDPEKFVMDHIPESALHHHRLTDYVVELLGDGTRHSCAECHHAHCCSTFQKQQAGQYCASQQSVLLLVVALLKPQMPTGSVKCTVLAVSIHIPSGSGALLSQWWVKPESTRTMIDRFSHHHADPADICKLAAHCLAKEFVNQLMSKYVAPHALQPVVLSNEAMLISGKSARVLLHPLLPICILGYRQQWSTP